MKVFILIALLLTLSVYTYDRSAVKAYAKKYWNSLNHDCSKSYTSCSPWSYWGSEHCGYESHGGDCANFVSQCLLAGGHPKLKGGACRGYPCGKEEVGARNLGVCLRETFGWKRTCGYKQAPPSGVQPGDVIIYHKGSCTDYSAHAVVVVEGGSSPKIACHSSMKWGASYTYLSGSKPYYEWLLYPGGSSPDPEPEPVDPSTVVKMVKIICNSLNRRKGPGTSYDSVGYYYKGDIVSVTGSSGSFYKDSEGYYFSSNESYVTDLVGTVTASSMNVRDAPNTSGKVLGYVYNGDKLTCLKTSNGWYYVTTPTGLKGWCSGTYISF